MDVDRIAVLLVEDNLADVRLLQELLREGDAQSWQIIHTERLSLGLQQVQQTEFDLILLDLSLPDSQGLDTIIQMQTAVPHIPIIVLTGSQDETMALQAVAQGAQDYLPKGQISPELLLKTAEYAIERMQILKRLQASERRFRAVFNQTFQFMGLLNSEGIFLDINQVTREVGGFKDEEILGRPLWQVSYWNQLEASQVWLKAAIPHAKSGKVLQSQIQAYTAAGSLLWLDVSIKPLKDEKGNVTYLIMEGRDITELKRAEAETQQLLEKERHLNQMKNCFISMVSHEFRSPMSTIQFATDVLQDCNLTEDRKHKYFGHIETAIDQMLDLLDEILLLGRTEAGKVEVEYALLDLETFCREVVETLQLTDENRHQILFLAQGNSIQARLDVTLLRHILVNLLSNAIKYSAIGTTIQLTLTYQNNQIVLCVQDQGIGIPKADQAKLFETFHRAENVGKVQGTGLGLAIVKRCVDLLHGQIQAESQLGVGTTFTVTLPCNL